MFEMLIVVLALLILAAVIFYGEIIYQLIKKTMHTLDEIVALVQQETTLEASLVALLTAAQNQVKADLALSEEQQAKVDHIFDGLTANITTLTPAVVANTPAEPATGGQDTPTTDADTPAQG